MHGRLGLPFLKGVKRDQPRNGTIESIIHLLSNQKFTTRSPSILGFAAKISTISPSPSKQR
jgi:hypothetical protein